MSEFGTVYLVGAGPGDPGLMTVRAVELIAAADAILYDRLIPSAALAGARDDAERIYVGKSPGRVGGDQGGSVSTGRGESESPGRSGGESSSQAEINALLVEAAARHKVVVRLKGGDPFVFGRGGEEAEALRAAGVPFEIVPGVTAGIAGPAYAGIPVTHRGEAGAVAFVTGHPAQSAGDWPALARFPGTLVFYMGVRRLAENCAALIAAGRDPREPAAVVESATLPTQRVIRAPLGELAASAADAGVRAPALVVVGPVAAHADRLAWLEPGPLAGVTVAVTRARAQAGSTSARLARLGAEVVELPTIRVVPKLEDAAVGEALDALRQGRFDLLSLTSVNGVELLFAALERAGLDARALAGVEVAAIGPATVSALAARGIRADHRPDRAVAESLLESLAELDLTGRRALLAGAAGMRPVLAEGLAAAGAEVHQVVLYETVAEPVEPDRLAAALRADFITLASASAARNLAAILRDADTTLRGRLVSIGPITSHAARKEGLEVSIEAEEHTIEGLIAAIVDAAPFSRP